MARDRAVGGIVLAFVSFAFALGVSELFLRMQEPGVAHDLRGLHVARLDRPWLYGLRPGARGTLGVSGDTIYEVNADGYRGRLVERPKPPNVFRILVLGDSLTFGYGVATDEVYPARMESLLGRDVEVVNLGVGGYNPYNEAALLADVGPSFEPDLVLVQFCTNDLTDPTLHFDAQTRVHLGMIPDAAFPDPAVRGEGSSPGTVGLLRLCRSMRVCQLLDDAWIRWTAPSRAEAETLAALRSPDHIPAGATRGWLADHYRRMATLSHELGAEFAVVAFPFRAQLEGTASHRLQGELVALGEEGGWETLDLLPEFVAAEAAGDGPLFLDLWHPSAAGHRVAARLIVADLERRNLLVGVRRG